MVSDVLNSFRLQLQSLRESQGLHNGRSGAKKATKLWSQSGVAKNGNLRQKTSGIRKAMFQTVRKMLHVRDSIRLISHQRRSRAEKTSGKRHGSPVNI